MNVQSTNGNGLTITDILDMMFEAASQAENDNPDIDHQAQGKIENASFDFQTLKDDAVPYDEYEDYMRELSDMYAQQMEDYYDSLEVDPDDEEHQNVSIYIENLTINLDLNA